MAEFNGKQGHWVTTESGSHIFIESDGTFDEAVEKAFGKENKGKYKADKEDQNSYGVKSNVKKQISDKNISNSNKKKDLQTRFSDGYEGQEVRKGVTSEDVYNGLKSGKTIQEIISPDMDDIVSDRAWNRTVDSVCEDYGITKEELLGKSIKNHINDYAAVYQIRDDITSLDIYNALKDGKDFEDFVSPDGFVDTELREKILYTVADELGMDEDKIYDLWENSGKDSSAFDDDNDFENWDDEDSEYYYDPYEDEKYKTGLGEMQSTFDKPFWNDDDAKKIKKYLKANPDVRDAVEKDLTKKANYLGNSLAKQDLNDQLSLLNDFDTFTTTEMDSAPRDDLVSALQKAIHNKVNKK